MSRFDPALLEADRSYLFGLAYRLLGSAADADDVLQEAFLRAAELEDVRSTRALLTTIVTRLCLDEMRSARRRRERYVGPWLPEPILTAEPAADSRMDSAESLSMAFLILLEALSPLERAVFVLRDVLELEFDEIAATVNRSEAACRQLLHRAREHIAARRARYAASPAAVLGMAAAFMNALASGDLDRLTELFTSDVFALSDHGGKAKAMRRTVRGAERVGRLLQGLLGKLRDAQLRSLPAWLNGSPALVVLEGERIGTAVLLDVIEEHGTARVCAVRFVRNPDKLARLSQVLA